MMLDYASGRGAQHGMMTGDMAGHRAHRRAFHTALGVRAPGH